MTHARPSDILVADDDGATRSLLHALLTQAGYRVHLATDGDDALAQCVRHGSAPLPAALALLDMTMPNRDGIATCRSLRQLPGWRHVPIVMVTSNSTDRAVRAALHAGIDGFLVKPFSSPELLQRVALWISGQAGATRPREGFRPTAGQEREAAVPAGEPHVGMPGVAWNVGRHGLGSHERGEVQDISHLLLARPGLAPF